MSPIISLALAGFTLSEVERPSLRFLTRDGHLWSLRVECDSPDTSLDPRIFVGASARVESRGHGATLAASGVVSRARRGMRRGARVLTLDITSGTDAHDATAAFSVADVSGPADVASRFLLVEHSLEAFVELMVQLIEAPEEEVAIFERFGVRGAGDRDRLLDVWRERWGTEPAVLEEWRRLYDARRRRR